MNGKGDDISFFSFFSNFVFDSLNELCIEVDLGE